MLDEDVKPDMSFDYANCSLYDPAEHHHGLCGEDDMACSDCQVCPVHVFFGLWELGEG